MKKQIAMLLCTAAVLMSAAMPPALASGGPFYPIDVEEYTADNDEPRISKVYQLSLADDPSGIPTEDFERGGRLYYLLDMIKEDEVGVDTQDYTESITQDSDTKDLAKILQQLDAHREVTTEDGYTGLLALDFTSVEVKAKGYKTSTQSLSATRTYPGLSDADLSLIPKTITDNGKELVLGAVEWSGGGEEYYTATATYTGTSSSSYATGYTVTANYTGQVTKTSCEVVIYTAVFGSMELPKDEEADPMEPESLEDPAETGAWTVAERLPLLGCAGGVAALLAAGIWSIQKIKKRRKN